MNENRCNLTFRHDPDTRVTWCNEDDEIWIDQLIGVRSEKSYLLTIRSKKIGFSQGNTYKYRRENNITEKIDSLWLVSEIFTHFYGKLLIPVDGHSSSENTFCFESAKEQNFVVDVIKSALSVRPIFSYDMFDKTKYRDGIPVHIDPKLQSKIDSGEMICV